MSLKRKFIQVIDLIAEMESPDTNEIKRVCEILEELDLVETRTTERGYEVKMKQDSLDHIVDSFMSGSLLSEAVFLEILEKSLNREIDLAPENLAVMVLVMATLLPEELRKLIYFELILLGLKAGLSEAG